MSYKRILLAGAGMALVVAAPVAAQSDNSRIIDEGMNRSQLPLTASELMDRIGPRLTNSHNLRKAEDWAIDKLRELRAAG